MWDEYCGFSFFPGFLLLRFLQSPEGSWSRPQDEFGGCSTGVFRRSGFFRGTTSADSVAAGWEAAVALAAGLGSLT